MKIKAKDWSIFILLAALCFGFWYKFEYPRFAFVNLSFNKQQAFLEAKNYLQAKGVDVAQYANTIIFGANEEFNRYLQHAAGLKAEEAFIAQHDFDLFFWKVRFFKELQKEEYRIYVSPRTGKVISYIHIIEELEPREDFGKDIAKQKAEIFLQKNFGTDLVNYEFHEEKAERYEKRVEYFFSWEKKGVYIPWKQGQGGAKLLVDVTVAGDEIREFHKHDLDLPDKFLRYVENQLVLGECLYRFFYVIFLTLLFCSINIVLKRKNDFIPRLVKKWFYYLAGFLAIINIIDILNNLQNIVMNYPTSTSWSSFLGISITSVLFSVSFLVLSFIMPGIAGESLCNERLPRNKYSAFLYYIKSNFFNRGLTSAVLLGYLVWVIMSGLQATIFYFGQKFLGVWREWNTMTYFSSAYVPLFSMFVISFTASFKEEVIFRIFGISLAKKYLRNSILAVVVTSIIWGMGHAMYAIFPVWFRIIEISLIGFFYGFIFLRFGIIPLIVAHYLFNVFWCSAAYILGRSTLYLFFGSIGALCIPLGFAIIAYFLNRGEREKQGQIPLDKIQKYNLGILITFVSIKKSQGCSRALVKEELIDHNWDQLLVNLAIEEVFDKKS